MAGYYGELNVPKGKRKNLAERELVLFTQGGMMNWDSIRALGTEINLLEFPRVGERNEIAAIYNYFEDARWDGVGFDVEAACLYSGKNGTMQFDRVTRAAYVLAEFYSDTLAITASNTKVTDVTKEIGWINYLFGESYTNVKRNNLCELHRLVPEGRREQALSELLGSGQQELRVACDPLLPDSQKKRLPIIPPVKTSEFLNCSDDDRAFWWTADGDVTFSENMEQWMADLSEEMEEILATEGDIIAPGDFFMTFLKTLNEANHSYRRVYAFSTMFQEFVGNAARREYQAAVVLLQRLLKRYEEEIPVLEEARWPSEFKLPGRKKIKKYLAILANTELRQCVFGF